MRDEASMSRARRVATYAVLAVFAVIALFPFYWMLRTAITPVGDAFSAHPVLWPTAFTLSNLTRVLTSPSIPFALEFRNSVLVAVGTTLLVLIAGTWGAYALARLRFRGRTAFGVSLLLVQFFPGVLLIIPVFVVLVTLHLVNQLFGLVLAFSTLTLPFVVWLLRSYFISLPAEIEDAARVDGCTYFGVVFRIVMPTALPGLAAAATLAFVNAWNEFLFAYVLMSNPSQSVLAVGLSGYIAQFSTDYPGLFTMASLTTIPVVVLFLLFQRSMVRGFGAGAVKG